VEIIATTVSTCSCDICSGRYSVSVTPTYQAEVERKVQQGVALLDRHCPGWEDRVNPKTVNIQSNWQCVVAQVFAKEHAAAKMEILVSGRAPEFSLADPFSYGYDILVKKLDGGFQISEYGFGGDAYLNQVWAKFITARINAKKAEAEAEATAKELGATQDRRVDFVLAS